MAHLLSDGSSAITTQHQWPNWAAAGRLRPASAKTSATQGTVTGSALLQLAACA